MDRHLNEVELNEALAGDSSPEIAEHLSTCAVCRSSRDEMEYLFNRLSDEADELAEKPTAFWLAQRHKIQNRVPQRRTFFAPRFAWVGIAATVLLGIALLLRPGTPEKQQPVQLTAENDQQLLVDVEQTLDSKLAPPLEPTDVLVGAMTQARSNHSQPAIKENRNEN